MPNWHSINDSLPDLDVPVLVAIKTGQMAIVCREEVHGEYLIRQLGRNWDWFPQLVGCQDDYWCDFDHADVTHWAPLPSLPAEYIKEQA